MEVDQRALELATRLYDSSPQWHPVMSAMEVHPGVWLMMAQWGKCYGIIRIVEIGGERGYRSTTWAEASEDRELIGYYRTLRAAAMGAHHRYLSAGTPELPATMRYH